MTAPLRNRWNFGVIKLSPLVKTLPGSLLNPIGLGYYEPIDAALFAAGRSRVVLHGFEI